METGKWKMGRPATSADGATPRRCLSTFSIFHLTFSIAAVLVAAGCSDKASTPTTRPSTVRERQEAALRDPFGYSPYGDSTDISGGDIKTFDKDGFKKDLDHVLNP